MKKNLLLALCAVCGMGYAMAQVSVTPSTTQDRYYNFQMEANGQQQIMYQHTLGTQSLRFFKFQPEFLVPAQVIEDNADDLPVGAKVVDITLNGWNNGSTDSTSQNCTLWISSTTDTQLARLLWTDFTYDAGEGMTQFSADQVPCPIPMTASAEAPEIIIETPLNSGVDPFIYDGNNILVKMWIENYDVTKTINYFYQTNTYGDSTAGDVASTYRTNLLDYGKNVGFNFNAQTKTKVQEQLGDALMYNLKYNTIPAFGMKYYTNDLFVNNESEYPYELKDENGNTIAPTGNAYYNLDYTQTYTLYCGWDQDKNKPVEKTISFGSIWYDLYVTIGPATAVEEINATRQVSSVRYYNVAGQQSAQPFDGLNIMVTTYDDGTISANKVMK